MNFYGWISLREDARVKRLRAELEGQDGTKSLPKANSPVPPHIEENVSDLETEQLRMRKQDLDKERNFLKRSLQTSQEQLDTLTAIEREDEDTLKQSNENVARVKNSYGLVD